MSEFDSIMVRVEVGANRKLRRFSPDERWCVIAGVWALAAKSPLRGYLLIAERVSVEVEDIAEQAGVKVATAKATLAKMRDLGMIELDEELGAEHVHDWHTHQKEPRQSESRAAWRERKRKQRADKARELPAGVTATVPRDDRDLSHPAREEKRSKGNNPPLPPASGGRQRDRDRFDQQLAAWVADELPHLPAKETAGLVRAALGSGLKGRDEILAYLARWNTSAAEAIEAVA